MSDSNSDTEAGLGQIAAANASGTPASLAALDARHLERLIEEKNWHDFLRPDFRERVLAAQYRFRTGHDSSQQKLNRQKSDSSSMAVSVDTARSSAFGSPRSEAYPPSLGAYSSVYSGHTLRTSLAESFFQPNILDEGPEGALEVTTRTPAGRLACSFGFLACEFRSNDLGEWDTHCQSHFHGDLPVTADCPFRCDWSRTAASGQEAWDARIIHVVSQHRSDEAIDANRRPDGALLQHLWRKGIIDDAQMKELRKHGRLTGTQIFLRNAGAARESRQQRRQHAPRRG